VSWLSLLALIPHPWFRAGGTLLTLCVALAGAILTALTAHYGGDLVYTHGVGTALLEKRLEAEKAALAATPGAVPAAPAVDPELVPIREIVMSEAERVSFKNDIWPIIETRCLDCHDGPEGDGAYDVTSIATMSKAGEKGGPGIVPGDPDASSIVKYIRGELKPRMPKKKPAMPEDELHLIRLWIAAGAKEDATTPAPSPAPVPVVSEEPAMVSAPVLEAPEPVMPAPAEPVVEPAPIPAALPEPAPVAVEESAPILEPEVMPEPVQEVVQVSPVEETPVPVPAQPVEVITAPVVVDDASVTPVEVPAVEAAPEVMTEQTPEVVPAPEAPAEASTADALTPVEVAPTDAAQQAPEAFDPFAAKQVSAPAAAPVEEAVQMEIATPVEAVPVHEQETEFEPDPAAAGE
jgi:hypothetical protein